MASEILQGDPNDELNKIHAKLDKIERALPRAQGTTGLIVTDKVTEALIEVMHHLTEQVRLLRDGDDDSGIQSGGINVFDPNDRPWEQN